MLEKNTNLNTQLISEIKRKKNAEMEGVASNLAIKIICDLVPKNVKILTVNS
jgi:hypothetical protein